MFTRKAALLQSEDLGKILDELCPISTKWREFGLALKVNLPKLEHIKIIPEDTKDTRLTEVLIEWFKESLKHTWEVIVEALRKRSVGERRLATRLEEKYCQGTCLRG